MKKILIVLAAMAAIVAAAAHNYADLYNAALEAEAEKQFPRAIDFLERALAECPPDSLDDRYAIHLKLREISSDAGDFDRAIRNGRACIDLMRPDAVDHPEFLMFPMMMQANILSMAGDSAAAFAYLDSAKLYTAGRSQYAYALHTIAGVIYNKFGNWSRAIENYRRMVRLVEPMDARDNTLRAFNLLGNALGNSGDYAEAARIYSRQADSARVWYGDHSTEYLWALQLQAHMAGFMGDFDSGASLYSQVASGYRTRVVEMLRILPSEQRSAMLGTMIDVLRRMVPYGMGIGNDYSVFMRSAYESLLLTKGLLLASDRSTRAVLAEHGSERDRDNFARLSRLQEDLNQLEANPRRSIDSVYSIYLAIKELDADIARSCAPYHRLTDFTATAYDDIRAALEPDDVLLDFDSYTREDGIRRIVCFEIRRNMDAPLLHKVVDANSIDSLLTLENNVRSNLYTGEAAVDMERLIGRVLDSIAGSASRIFYVPADILHSIAPDAIPVRGTLLGDIRSMRRLSSARELLNRRPMEAPRSAALFGAIEFDDSSGLGALPNSRLEIDSISRILSTSAGVHTFADISATRENLLALSGDAPDILHLSTHGFYYTPGSENLPSELQGYADAMSLSGLALQGGIISAREVAAMDLTRTDLVSIASCHSGDGQVTAEGIYGLQRAFKKAGAQTLLLSLWEVSDAAASLFMTEFYRELTADPDPYRAFRAARAAVRAGYPDPFYWASFVLVD